MSCVPSVPSESMTMVSSAHATDCRHRPIIGASFFAITITDKRISPQFYLDRLLSPRAITTMFSGILMIQRSIREAVLPVPTIGLSITNLMRRLAPRFLTMHGVGTAVFAGGGWCSLTFQVLSYRRQRSLISALSCPEARAQ